MADHFDDGPSFWGEQPTSRLRRPEFERTREHRVVPHHVEPERPAFYDQHVDAEDDEAWTRFGTTEVEPRVDERRRRGAAGVDPRLLRMGALAAAAVVLLPVIVALAADDDRSGDEVRSEAPASTIVTTVAPPLSESTVAPGVVEITAAVRPVPDEVGEPDDADDEDAQAAAAVGEKAPPTDEATETASASTVAAAVAEPPAEESAAAEPECAGTYVVVEGDYWLRFVDSSGASLEEWLEANDAQPETQMYVGDELCIPAGAQAPAPIETTSEAPDTTAAPDTSSAPVPETTTAPTTETTTAPPPPETTAAPAPETTAATTQPPAPTDPPAPPPTVPAGAPSTESLCGGLPTQNGSTGAGPAEVEAIIREVWPDDIEVRALCIAKREANLRPDLNNWCCYGVFALYFSYVPDDLKQLYGVDEPSDLWNARTNIEIAYQIYLRGGWDPWSQTDPGAG